MRFLIVALKWKKRKIRKSTLWDLIERHVQEKAAFMKKSYFSLLFDFSLLLEKTTFTLYQHFVIFQLLLIFFGTASSSSFFSAAQCFFFFRKVRRKLINFSRFIQTTVSVFFSFPLSQMRRRSSVKTQPMHRQNILNIIYIGIWKSEAA